MGPGGGFLWPFGCTCNINSQREESTFKATYLGLHHHRLRFSVHISLRLVTCPGVLGNGEAFWHVLEALGKLTWGLIIQ